MGIETDSLERLVPDHVAADEITGQETLRLHLERFEFAARHVNPGRLLDIACGVGYGTRLLADNAPELELALGVDISEQAVDYAQQRYAGGIVRFEQADALNFKDVEGFDTIVSLETIEHVQEPARLVDRLVALLKPGGILISSVPTTPSVDFNPHHLTDFSERTFRALLGEHDLSELTAFEQVQPVRPLAVLRRDESRMQGMRTNLLGYYARSPGSFLRRITSTLRHGFCNKYLTIVARKSPTSGARP